MTQRLYSPKPKPPLPQSASTSELFILNLVESVLPQVLGHRADSSAASSPRPPENRSLPVRGGAWGGDLLLHLRGCLEDRGLWLQSQGQAHSIDTLAISSLSIRRTRSLGVPSPTLWFKCSAAVLKFLIIFEQRSPTLRLCSWSYQYSSLTTPEICKIKCAWSLHFRWNEFCFLEAT